jgi:hypothetical protein
MKGFLYPWLCNLRASAHVVPVLAWISGSAVGIARLSLPERFGGMAELALPPFNEEELATGMREVKMEGKVICVDGCPEMYDYEYKPQATPFVKGVMIFEHLYTQ